MARTAPVPNFAAIPGMNPGLFVLGGGGDAGGSGAGNGKGGKGKQGADGKNGGKDAKGGGKNAGACGAGANGSCPNPAHGGSGTAAGDPVDLITGRVYTTGVVDLSLPGPIPLVVERSYCTSDAAENVGLGWGWTHSLAFRIEEMRRTVRVLQPGASPLWASRPTEGATTRLPCGMLRRDAGGYVLSQDGLFYVFAEHREGTYWLSRIVDRHGNAITLRHEDGQLTGAVDSAGREVRVRRRPDGLIDAFEVRNAASQGRWIRFRSYSYDDAGNLVAAIDPQGHAMRFEYDDEHRLVRRSEPGGLVACFRYDDVGRCVESFCTRDDDGLDEGAPEVLADGVTTARGFLHVKLDFGPDFSQIATSRAVRRMEGSALEQPSKATWSGGVHSFSYDAAGALTEYVDALERVTRIERGADGRVLRRVDPTGASTEQSFDDLGQLAEVRDVEGGAVRYERDARGNVIRVDDAMGLVVAYTYDDRGLLASATTPNGAVTRMEYDAHGNRVTVVEPNGGVRRIRHDFLGRMTGFDDELGRTTSYVYDDCGRMIRAHHPDGGVERFAYDPDGQLAEHVDGDGRVTALRWGGAGVVTEIVRPSGDRVRFRYDREQELVRIVNELGESYVYERAGDGRVVAERTFDGRRIELVHDAMGQIVAIREGARLTELAYDAAGRIVERVHDGEITERLAYDAVGRLVSVTTDAATIEYTYDARGRVIGEKVTAGGRTTTLRAEVDAMGDVVRFVAPGADVQIERDVMGSPVRARIDEREEVTFAYDAAGRLVERTLPAGGRIRTTAAPHGALARVEVWGAHASPPPPGAPEWVGRVPPGQTFARDYQWTPGHRLAAVSDPAGAQVELLRDAVGRVIERRAVEGARHTTLEVFGWDPSGNAHEPAHTRAYDPGGRLAGRGEASYAYDDLGRLVEKCLVTGETWTYEWSADDTLRAVRLPDGRAVRFAYDGFSRRIEKRVERDGNTESATHYVWWGNTLVSEIRERAAASGDPVVEERTYLGFPGSPLPFAERTAAPGEEAETRYYVEAPNGIPEALVTADGAVVGELGASLFGVVDGSRAGLTPRRFPGQQDDLETGLYYNRHRYYDAETGQYVSPEPLRLDGGSLKAYQYVDGLPTEMVDLEGLQKMHTDIVGTATRPNGNSATINSTGTSGQSGADSLHPAVQAALTPNNARPANNGGSQSNCSEPKALSDYLNRWERTTGKSCQPGDPNWQTHLNEALKGIKSVKSYRGNKKDNLEQACPNCSQLIPRLWGMANLPPPGTDVVPGGFTSQSNPAQNTTGPNYDPGWNGANNRGQSPITTGPSAGQTYNQGGNPVQPGAHNWDGNQWNNL